MKQISTSKLENGLLSLHYFLRFVPLGKGLLFGDLLTVNNIIRNEIIQFKGIFTCSSKLNKLSQTTVGFLCCIDFRKYVRYIKKIELILSKRFSMKSFQ